MFSHKGILTYLFLPPSFSLFPSKIFPKIPSKPTWKIPISTMYPIKEEKLQAMNKNNKSQFLYNLMLHSLTALTCSLFCFYPYWFPSICSSMKHVFFVSLPNVWSFFSNPKFLFIVGNAIVIFLIGESKLASSHSPAVEIYDEYVERSRSHRGLSTLKEKKEEMELEINVIEESVNRVGKGEVVEGTEKEQEEEEEKKVDDHGDDGVGDGGNHDDDDDDDVDDKDRDGEEQLGLPIEELNKKVEEFIARVNKQRWLEAKSLVCGM